MSTTHTPEELGAQEPRARDLVNKELALSKLQRDILNVVIDWSLKCGRQWAEFESWEHVAALARSYREHVSVCTKNMQGDGLVHCMSRRGMIRLRFLPSGALVEPPRRIDARELAGWIEKARHLNKLPDGFDPNGQKQLPLETPEESVDNDLARESRNRAMAGVSRAEGASPEAGAERTDSVRSELGLLTRARAGAGGRAA